MVVANFRGRFIVSIIMLSVSSWLSIGNEVDKHGRREDKQLGIYLDWMMLNPISDEKYKYVFGGERETMRRKGRKKGS